MEKIKTNKYSIKVLEEKNVIYSAGVKSSRRLLNRLAKVKWEKNTKVYLKVSYGYALDCFNKRIKFYNDGWYKNKSDFLKAFKRFDELTIKDFDNEP